MGNIIDMKGDAVDTTNKQTDQQTKDDKSYQRHIEAIRKIRYARKGNEWLKRLTESSSYFKLLISMFAFSRYKHAFNAISRDVIKLSSEQFSLSMRHFGHIQWADIHVVSTLFGDCSIMKPSFPVKSDSAATENIQQWVGLSRLIKPMAILDQYHNTRLKDGANEKSVFSPMQFFKKAPLITRPSYTPHILTAYRKRRLLTKLIRTANAVTRKDFCVKCIVSHMQDASSGALKLEVMPIGYYQRLRGHRICLFDNVNIEALSLAELKSAISFIKTAANITMTAPPNSNEDILF